MPESIARRIDHTCLRPEATVDDIDRLCDEALQYEFYSVCVPPVMVARAAGKLCASLVRVGTVAGFPHGNTPSAIKRLEAEAALAAGAVEIDMVIALGALRAGDDDTVVSDIAGVVAVMHAAPGTIAKVILETSLLTEREVVRACVLAERAGADFIKTSTGFGASGATIASVRRMRANVSSRVGVKAAGGIRDYATAVAMIEAGASRLGTSASVAIVEAEKLTR